MTTQTFDATRLSPGQSAALEAIAEWFNDPNGAQVFRMFGPAGTGKTTIARLVPEFAGVPMHYFGAFSGKAVNVLRTKGCNPAYTLHRLMYGAPINLKQALKAAKKRLDDLLAADRPSEDEAAEALDALIEVTRESVKDLESRIKKEGGLRFDVNVDSPLRELADQGGLLIADEVSMVGDRMARDLLSFGCRVLVLGDPFQLPPVRGEGTFTAEAPDIMLTEIHRQAADSPVLSLATSIRTGSCDFGDWRKAAPRLRPWYEYDQVLTWRRATRWNAVRAFREREGRQPGVPEAGDRVMCLANNSELQVFNGQTWLVVKVEDSQRGDDQEVLLHLIDESDDPSDPEFVYQVHAYLAAFNEDDERKAEESRLGGGDDDTMLATFANALTVHKAQGSEWGTVLVMDETRDMFDMQARRGDTVAALEHTRRWMYTAVTRAAKEVAIIPSNRRARR